MCNNDIENCKNVMNYEIDTQYNQKYCNFTLKSIDSKHNGQWLCKLKLNKIQNWIVMSHGLFPI